LLSLCKLWVTAGNASIDTFARLYFQSRFKQDLPSASICTQFGEAYREYAFLDHSLEHLRLTPQSEEDHGPGVTECPACTPSEEYSGVLTYVCAFN
jgi:hypothetical protein